MFDNMFNGVMGKIAPGMCRLSMNGRIAIKTSDGYKTYNPKTGALTNCSQFVLDLADDMFMVMPTRKLSVGDIVLINGKPVYVLEIKDKNRVEVIRYEDSTIQTVIPERHALMGRRFYGKIVSLFGSGLNVGGKNGFFKNMLKLKMMGAMLGGGNSMSGDFSQALPMMMLMGGGQMDGLFDGVCCGDEDDEDDDVESTGLFGFDEDDQDDQDSKPVKKGKKSGK